MTINPDDKPAVEAGRKPRTGLKPDEGAEEAVRGSVEAGRKPRTGLKLDVTVLTLVADIVASRQGENPGRD